MKQIGIILVLIIVPIVENTVYIFNTKDTASAEFYDCIHHQDLLYCRRPEQSISLQRDDGVRQCYHNGKLHSFTDLLSNNSGISTILHEWKSSIEKVEQYSRYMRQSAQSNNYLCECSYPPSFGKKCEYRLPQGITIDETLTWQLKMKGDYAWKMQVYGDTVCYTTLECDYGLLCLDWRDICDGAQNCMSGFDEDYCDKLEFNECEDDEYRCINGMCIPQEYFLDGEFDCLDWSDETQYYFDATCTYEGASAQCDDRICPPNQWSCGSGQCISDRLGFMLGFTYGLCENRRDQYYMCEAHSTSRVWTLPDGRCILIDKYDELNFENNTSNEECQFLLKCGIHQGRKKHCPCGGFSFCFAQPDSICSTKLIPYPQAGVVAPYITNLYDRKLAWFDRKQYPDIAQINGTLKCRGFSLDIIYQRMFPYFRSLRELEHMLCTLPNYGSVLEHNGYDQHCNNRSRTFNNRSYNFIDICNRSKECISAYRIKDGILDCADGMDEVDDKHVTDTCSSVQRYRFRCSNEETICLTITALGDLHEHCKNKFDELWMGTNRKLSSFSCNTRSKDDCDNLRQYIEMSWSSENTNQSTSQLRIPFRAYCDTFWSLASREDENVHECRDWWVCPEDQWQCRSGQCINASWVLDEEYDCSDASDEEGIFALSRFHRNLKVIQLDELNKRYNTLHALRPFATICNLSIEFPCLRANVSDPIRNLTSNRPCIGLHQIGDGRADCYGAIDERNSFEYCNHTTMLGNNFKCLSSNHCTSYWLICSYDGKCPNRSDTGLWCNYQDTASVTGCSSGVADFKCFNGSCARGGRCNRIVDCPFGEDEYMCDYQSGRSVYVLGSYRQVKEVIAKKAQQRLRLPRFPNDSTENEFINDIILPRQMARTSVDLSSSLIPYLCNRGIGIEMYNGSTICFCPPQYYGDRCQFHSDRITILIHLNLSQSAYTSESDRTIVLKLLVLFLFNNKTLATHEFHVRPAVEMNFYKKKMVHFVYSRSNASLRRVNIIYDHPYSIRIEGNELKLNEQPRIIAVWQYPVYFHYLPVFRLAKILRLSQSSIEENPCSNKPCNQHQQCQQILNDRPKYICLCKSNFMGENCSVEDPLCVDGYCSFKALCKSNSRYLLHERNLPHCVCPLNRFGEQCDIEYDRCWLDPCQNGGSCFPTSKPGQFLCLCTDQYYGSRCELRKPGIRLYINETLNHAGAIVQCFKINLVSLDLILVHQRAHTALPTLFEYRHIDKMAPEIVLVKLFSSHSDSQGRTYLLSLHINVTLIYGTTQVIKRNQCSDVRTLASDNATDILMRRSTFENSPIRYHRFCQIHPTLRCFHDRMYVCVCTEDHSRVECFGYDQNLDRCSYCLAGGRCLKGDWFQSNNYVCMCPPCHSGRNCQFNSNSFSFTLDQLFFTDLISTERQKLTLHLLIIGPLLLFFIALPSNLLSFITFRRRKCLLNGAGQYLLCMSVFNQINLGLLVARLMYLCVTFTSLQSHSVANNVFCKLFSYSLTCSTRIAYWLGAFVAIERVYTTLFLSGQWLKKPQVARRLMAVTFFVIVLTGAYEPVFIKSFSDINDRKGAICVTEFPTSYRSVWMIVHKIVAITNSILPLLINIFCTITIICVVTKKKMNIREPDKSKLNFQFPSLTHLDISDTPPMADTNMNALQQIEHQQNFLDDKRESKVSKFLCFITTFSRFFTLTMFRFFPSIALYIYLFSSVS